MRLITSIFTTLGLALAMATPVSGQSGATVINGYLAHPESSYVLTNVRIIDGTGADAVENSSIIISEGRISTIADASTFEVPDGMMAIDASGQTVLPGLVMMHEHLMYLSDSQSDVFDTQVHTIPTLLLASGITTARTAGADLPQVDIAIRDRITAGQAVGPNLIITGPYFNGQREFSADVILTDAESARTAVRYWAAMGVDWVKVYSQLSPELVAAVIEEAGKHDLRVAGHLGPGTSCAEASRMGIDTIEHALLSCWIQPTPEALETLIATLLENDTTIVSNGLARLALDGSLADGDARAVVSPVLLDEFRNGYAGMPPGETNDERGPLYLPETDDRLLAAIRFEKAFVAAGGRLLLGADAVALPSIPGFANHDVMVVQAETFRPLDVIRMATSDAADYLGIGDERGRVREGMVADLLLVDGSPDVDMADIRAVSLVIKDGRAYSPEKLLEAVEGRLGIN